MDILIKCPGPRVRFTRDAAKEGLLKKLLKGSEDNLVLLVIQALINIGFFESASYKDVLLETDAERRQEIAIRMPRLFNWLLPVEKDDALF